MFSKIAELLSWCELPEWVWVCCVLWIILRNALNYMGTKDRNDDDLSYYLNKYNNHDTRNSQLYIDPYLSPKSSAVIQQD